MGVYKWETNETHNLPSAYQEVEWIGNSGTQYIDTGVAIPNHKAIANIEYTAFNGWMYLGAYMGPDSGVPGGHLRLYGGRAGTTGQFCYGFISSYSEYGGSVSLNTKYELEVSTISGNLYFKHDGTTYGTSSATYTTSKAGNYGILAQNNEQAWEIWNSAKVYDYKVYDSSDVLLKDFVPCYRIADGVIGMYDLVNDIFYTNNGSGIFTKGPDVNEYKEKELRNAYIGIPDPTSIVLDKNSITLTTVGQTEQLTATIEPTVSDKTITWTTSDSTVATVSTTGLVTCVTPGTATITASTVNGLTATCGVTDQQGWQPGANTIAYYPLDRINTVNDLSGNNHTLTNNGITFGTYNGVDCAYNASSNYMTCDLGSKISDGSYTLNIWAYKDGGVREIYLMMFGVGDYYSATIMQRGSGGIINYACWFDDISTPSAYPTGAWTNIVFTYNKNTRVKHIYVNGVDASSGTGSASYNLRNTNFYLFSWYGGTNDFFYGNLSNFIIEDKERTSQEVSDYYNLTKSLYGIS